MLQFDRINRIKYTRGLPNRYDGTVFTNAIERSCEISSADTIEHGRNPYAASNRHNFGDKIRRIGDDYMRTAVRLGMVRLRGAADRSNHDGAQMRSPLTQNSSNSARGRVHQNHIARFDGVARANEAMNGNTAIHQRGSIDGAYIIRQMI